jgi:Uncharacterised nucleotidyltransferase
VRRPGFPGDIWPDEIQELLLHASLRSDERGSAAWFAVRPRIDVDHLPGELHRLMPLLSKTLTVRGVDDPDLARLKGVYQFSWYRNTMLFTDAAELLHLLGTAEIQTMLLRGAAIAIGYRGDVGIRAMNDMDVLVPPGDLDRARNLAREAGWHPLLTGQPLERLIAAAPVRNADGRVVRIHWQPSANLSLPDTRWDELWQRAVPVRVCDTATYMPSAADHLVHACVDGARANSGSSLRWIADAMAILSAPTAQLNWDVVVAEAGRLRVSLLLSDALRYLQQTLDAIVPPLALSALKSTPTSFRDRMAHRLSLTTTPRVASAGETLGRFLRLTADLNMLQAAATLPDFCAAVLGVERDPRLPVLAVKKVVRAAVSPTPPLASFSRAGAASTVRSENTARGTSESGLSTG